MADSSDCEEFEITDLVHQFMAITGAEDTVALSYLQQSKWNLGVSRVFFWYHFSFPILKSPPCRLFNFLIFQSAINNFFDPLSIHGGYGSKENPVLVSEQVL